MARTTITSQRPTSAGLAPAYEPANVDGNQYRLTPGRVLHVKNGSGADLTVTVPTPASADRLVDGLAVPDRTYTIATAAERLIALGTSPAYRQAGGVAHINYSAATSVTVALFEL